MRRLLGFVVLLVIVAGAGSWLDTANACGGLFCQNIPVDQQAERIIFAVNDDATISAYVQINYTGSAPDFSWVVPVPSVPELDVAEVETFDELTQLTRPRFIVPDMPDCAMVVMEADAESVGVPSASSDDVEVLAQGSVGPYDYSVITSPDPDALIIWLRENEFRVTEPMEPLIHVYNEEGMVFLAMKLQGEAGVQDIQPVVMTYESHRPMIPLRLTAVAANPNMAVVTWIFAKEQAYPVNYAHPIIKDEDIRVFPFIFDQNGDPFTNYLQLVDNTVDLYEGRAFVTEYADDTESLMNAANDPLVKELLGNYDYVTRFLGRISPEEMTVDPVFDFDADRADVSNIHDLTKFDPEVVYGCDGSVVEVEFDNDVVPDDWR
ncbi:MAG: DUF2330 domain-containing protein [Chloroflexi bacterium]|nr:DUF2330 domain-containing protein [Chloroflexota bacterium]